MAGVTVNGFEKKTFQNLLEDLRTQYQSEGSFGPTFGFNPGDAQYHIVTPIAMAISTLWDVAETVYNNNSVDQAAGSPLDYKVKDNGIRRNQANRATGTERFIGENGTIIPIGFIISSGSIQYRTTASGTISSGNVDLAIEAVVGGANGNNLAGTITFINSPLAGLTSVSNITDTTGGTDQETDEQLKVRNLRSLAKGGGSTPNAIRASILQVSGVTSAFVRNNETLSEVDGVPGKSIAPVVQGGNTEAIQDAIFAEKAGGPQCFGTLTKSYTDDNNNIVVIGITRPIETDVYIRATVTHTTDYPVDGDTRVRDLIVTAVNALTIGQDVIRFSIATAVGREVTGITNLVIETSADGTTYNNSDFTIAELAIAVTDNAKVTVV